MKVKFSVLISTCLGIGYFPKFPGTIGSIAAFGVYLLLPESYFVSLESGLYFVSAVILLSLLSVPVVSKAEEYLGHDCGKIVIDEFWGYMLAVAFMPKSIWAGVLGLIFFRIFDIWKPEPINALQKLPKGWGVMADDLLAGIFACVITHILLKLF